MDCVEPAFIAFASWLGRYPNRAAASSTAIRVRALADPLFDNTRAAADLDTPAALATSMIVAGDPFRDMVLLTVIPVIVSVESGGWFDQKLVSFPKTY
ncbi:hypothetical protein GCM10009860_09110 [Microbacterium mitrae]